MYLHQSLLFILLLCTQIFMSTCIHAQSRKEQIVILTDRVDSLNTILSTTRDNASKDIESRDATIYSLKSEIAQLSSDNSSLESFISTLEEDKSRLTFENEKLKTDLEEISKKNLELQQSLRALENNNQNRNLIDDSGIGKIKLGKTLDDINTLCETKIIREEWNEMAEYHSEITCTFDNSVITASRNEQLPRIINELRTESDHYKTSEGFHTGMPVSKLRELYSIEEATGEGAQGIGIKVKQFSNVRFIVSVKNQSRNNLRKYNYWEIWTDNLPDDLIIDEIAVLQ